MVKLVNKTNSKRSQPYSLAKPKVSNKPAVEENGLLFPNGSADSVSSNSQGTQPNAILSRLSNISNTFKSIFVRPKHTKPVDLDSFNKRTNNPASTSQNQNTNDQTDATKFKINLFSVSSNRPDNNIDELTAPSTTETLTNPSYDMNQQLEKIISRNVMMESYTNKLNKQIPEKMISQENTHATMLNTLKKGTRASDSSSTISSMSSAQSNTDSESSNKETITRTSQSTSQHQRALLMSNNNNIIKSEVTAPKQPIKNLNNTISGPISKWTCMICLSKHTVDIEICLICGSNNNDKANKKVQISFNQSKNMSYDFKQKNFQNETIHEFSSPLRSLGNGNSQKTWICGYCTFANDNLKIVCMNCRASKQKTSNALGARLSHQTLQMKRKPANKQQMNNNKNQLNRSNEENENGSDSEDKQRGRSSKRSKTNDADQNNLCNNCKSCNLVPPTLEAQARTPTGQCGANSNKNCDNRKSLETPLRPKGFVDTPTANPSNSNEAQAEPTANSSKPSVENNQATSAAPSLLTKMLGNSNKWSCQSCLVSNEAEKTECACCSAKKPSASVSLAEPAKKPNSLFATTAASNASKWSCSTCLASNDSSKDACACCMTKRSGTATAAPATNSLFAAAAKSNSNKWSCGTCLASNDASKDACACCMTKRTGAGEKTEAPKTGLFASASKISGDKWECSSCLVKNESSTTTCACCSAAKPGSSSSSTEPTKTKFASLVAAAGTLTSNTSNISFGLKPKSDAGNAAPISFGTSNLTAGTDTGKISFGASSNPPSFGTTKLSFGSTTDTTSKPSSSISFGKPVEEAKPATSAPSLFGTTTAKPLTFGAPAPVEPTPTPAPTANQSGFLQISNPFSIQPTSEPQQKTVETQPKLFGFQSTNSPAPVKNEFIKTDAPNSLFGSSTVTEPAKPSFGGFGTNASTSTVTKTEAPKSSFNFSSEPPKQGLFGNSSITITSDKPAFGSSNTESKSLFGAPAAKAPSMFGSSQPSVATPSFGTTTEPAKPASSVFNFGAAAPAAPTPTPAPSTNFFGTPKPAAPATPAFGSSTTNTNVFGQLNQNTESTKPAFNFGQSQSVNTAPAAASPFQFGGASNNSQEKFGAPAKKQANDENKPLAFNFGGANTNTGFNFGGQATDSPLKVKSVTNQTPAGSPFVFGGASAPSADNTNLTQILAGPPTTPSTAGRPIRKATRMRKK